MKIYKIAQNLQYLQNIGVPPETAPTILEYLLSLEGDERRNMVRKVRQNPTITLEELKQSTVGKAQYLETQNVPPDIIRMATFLSSKHSVWIAREMMRWQKAVVDWGNQINWLKKKKNLQV